jgi:hypothetical protein
MRFTAEQNGDALYQEAFGALAYAKEPLYTKAPPAPAAPSLVWGFTSTGSVDAQRTSVGGGADSFVNTQVGVAAVDVTKFGIFEAKDALNFMLIGSDAFTSASGVHTDTPGVGAAITYINGGASADFIFNSGFSHTDGVSGDTIAYSYSTDLNYRWNYPDHWWIEPTVGATYSDAYTGGTFSGQVWTVQGGVRFGTEVALENGIKVQPTFTALAYSNVYEYGSSFIIPGQNGQVLVGGDQGQVWGKGSVKLNFIITPNFSTYVEGDVRGTSGDVTAVGYGGQLGLRWTW